MLFVKVPNSYLKLMLNEKIIQKETTNNNNQSLSWNMRLAIPTCTQNALKVHIDIILSNNCMLLLPSGSFVFTQFATSCLQDNHKIKTNQRNLKIKLSNVELQRFNGITEMS